MRRITINKLKEHTRLYIFLIICTISSSQDYEEGDLCDFAGYKGKCLAGSKCLNFQSLPRNQIGRCGFLLMEELVCCPLPNANEKYMDFIKKNLPNPVSRINNIPIDGGSVRDSIAPETTTAQPLGNDTDTRMAYVACETPHYKGICKSRSQCTHLAQSLTEMHLNDEDVTLCDRADIICCPIRERPAVRACRAIERSLMPTVEGHIYGGKKVSVVQYPHIAKIIYDVAERFCGGTLIHKRFVLTAAHCVIVRNAKPTKVLMGISNLTDISERRHQQVIDIEATYCHTNYTSFAKYFDIALIKLVKDVQFGPTVYPTCLHTDPTELPDGANLTVAGWGRTESDTTSSHLLAAQLNTVSNAKCNISYTYSIGRTLNHGIDDTQLCALAPGKDSCEGDSGGPLLLVKNPTHNSYRVVGVVSFGSTICGASLPGVYTKVSAFLDFIEAIVWPEL